MGSGVGEEECGGDEVEGPRARGQRRGRGGRREQGGDDAEGAQA